MRKFKLLNVADDGVLELKDVKGGITGFTAAYPDEVVYSPETDTFSFKKEVNSLKKLKEDIANNIIIGIVIVFFIWFLSLFLYSEPTGYYRASDENGIHYEWVNEQ